MNNTTQTHGENTLFPSAFLAHGQETKSGKETRIEPSGSATRTRLKFAENDSIAPPDGFSNRETWTAAVWLNALASDARRSRFLDLPPATADEIRRWFFHRWEGARRGEESAAVAGALANIGQLAHVRWAEVAAHYRRCPWADVIQEAFAAAREAGLAVDRKAATVRARRDTISLFINRPLGSCRELSRDEWLRVGAAIRAGALRW